LARTGAQRGAHTGACSHSRADARSTFGTARTGSANVEKVLELALAGTGCGAGPWATSFESTATSYVGATAADLGPATAANFRAGAGSRTRSRRGSGAATTRADSRTHRGSAWRGTSTPTPTASPATAAAAASAAATTTSAAATTTSAATPSQHQEVRTQKQTRNKYDGGK
jgi:hypothetical protein